MSEWTGGEGAAATPGASAGSILREARQAQGLHIAALAATIKVQQKKLEALESDRFEELLDPTFARALAQAVCRVLKIDPAPVLSQLPAPKGHRLEHVAEGINEPFRERASRKEPADWSILGSMAWWGPVFVVAALVLYFLPQGWLPKAQWGASSEEASSETTSGNEAQGASPGTVVAEVSPGVALGESLPVDSTAAPTVAGSAPVGGAMGDVASAATSQALRSGTVAGASGAVVAPGGEAGALVVRTRAASWVEVRDNDAKVLVARMMQAGETVSVDGPRPLRLKVGNAKDTEVVDRGQTIDLPSTTRDNVARLQLK